MELNSCMFHHSVASQQEFKVLSSPSLHLFDEKYSKTLILRNNNTVLNICFVFEYHLS